MMLQDLMANVHAVKEADDYQRKKMKKKWIYYKVKKLFTRKNFGKTRQNQVHNEILNINIKEIIRHRNQHSADGIHKKEKLKDEELGARRKKVWGEVKKLLNDSKDDPMLKSLEGFRSMVKTYTSEAVYSEIGRKMRNSHYEEIQSYLAATIQGLALHG